MWPRVVERDRGWSNVTESGPHPPLQARHEHERLEDGLRCQQGVVLRHKHRLEVPGVRDNVVHAGLPSTNGLP
eukprot:668297-Prorocentrum_minimum.AAC.1